MKVVLLYETCDLVGVFKTKASAYKEAKRLVKEHELKASTLGEEPFINISDYHIRLVDVK